MFIAFNINHSSILPLMALNNLYCADVPLSNYSLTHSLTCHAPRPARSSFEEGYNLNRYSVTVCGSILMRFSMFFHNWLAFQMYYIVLIFVARWRHNFRKIVLENCKTPKIGVKYFAPHFMYFKRISPHYFRAMNDPYKKIRISLSSAASSVDKVRHNSPKMARNEQVCAHQKQGSSRMGTHGNAVPVLYYTTGTSFPLFLGSTP